MGKHSKKSGKGKSSRINARMDLVRTTTGNKNHWKDADSLSARAAYTRMDRKTARDRSRHAALNNSWYTGMLRTAANHIIGTGPRLQVLTADRELNARIELAWRIWTTRIRFVEKLRIAVETYWRDGEVFGLRGVSSRTALGLDLRLLEGDQVSQPYMYLTDTTIDDGKRVDNFGNMVEAWVYDHHPGDIGIGYANFLKGRWHPAAEVWHLYRADRPGQLRGIPRCTPSLEWLEHMRRFSIATLSAAELFALMPVFVKTTGSGVSAAQMPEDMMTLDYLRGVLNFLPEGWETHSPNVTYPNVNEEVVQRVWLAYSMRCCNMPYFLASGSSKDSNFSSAKLDIKSLWEPEVKSERDAVTNVVLQPMFGWFLDDLALMPGVLDGAPPIDQIEAQFYWPPLPQADEIDVANAAVIRMSSLQTTPRQEALANGEDFDERIRLAAADYGVDEQTLRNGLFAKLLGVAPAAGQSTDQPEQAQATAGAFVGTKRRDFTNNLKQINETLDHYESGGSELVTKSTLMRLGLSEGESIGLIEERCQAMEVAP